MGHPMAKKSFRKRGDKFLKHQRFNGRFNFNQREEENENTKFRLDEEVEEEDTTIEEY